MPIDEFYDFKFGNLPYRSIKFKHSITESDTSGHVTINYSDSSKHTERHGGIIFQAIILKKRSIYKNTRRAMWLQG